MTSAPAADQRRPRIALVVNPIAGMGGPVALKGTDGAVDQARQRGAVPVAGARAVRFLRALPAEIDVVTCSGPMGADACVAAGRSCEVVVQVDEPTSAADTRRAVRTFAGQDVDLIVFVGGDGTAYDVASSLDHALVCLGVPSGVKMNSAVFADGPEAAARVAAQWLAGGLDAELAEVVEVDEGAVREGTLRPARLGTLRVPVDAAVAGSKAEPGGSLEGVVEAVEELARPGEVLVLGPGGTMLAAKEALVGDGTLLGVDVIVVGPHGGATLEVRDATAKDLAGVPDTAVVVVSPIGGQGFVLGRGNQQVVPDLLRRTGWDQLVVVATPQKLAGLDALRADTGDLDLDRAAPAHLAVLTGPGFRRLVPLRTGV